MARLCLGVEGERVERLLSRLVRLVTTEDGREPRAARHGREARVSAGAGRHARRRALGARRKRVHLAGAR